MNFNITKAWKDAQYRETLTSEELAQLPQNPIGALELTDEALETVSGACGANVQFHQNFYYGYQCDGFHKPHSRCYRPHCGGNNWFGGWQHSSGGGSCFGEHHGNCH